MGENFESNIKNSAPDIIHKQLLRDRIKRYKQVRGKVFAIQNKLSKDCDSLRFTSCHTTREPANYKKIFMSPDFVNQSMISIAK